MDGIVTGRITLYIALLWSVYVGAKSIYEAIRHYRDEFKGEVKAKREHHKRIHIAGLIGGAMVCLMQIIGYVWFDLKETGLETDDRTIGIFNILFINLYMLFNINHFKHERLGKTEKGTWSEILKF